jgi:hypothetical protein
MSMKALGSSLTVAPALAVVLLAAQAMLPAKAGLGQSVASVQADSVRLKGQLRARAGNGYSVQEITAANGTVVREYVSPAGVVFAVRWSGPAMPDLQQTLASYFPQYESTIQARRLSTRRGSHDHVEVRSPTLVVHAGGHMRQYFGIAYVPALMPANLSPSDLH